MARDAYHILLAAADPATALARLFDARKARNARFSLAKFCREAGLVSRGHASDLVHGKRALTMRHVAGVARGLGLDELGAEYLRHLVARARAKTPAATKSAGVRLALLEKTMRIVLEPAHALPRFFAFEVFAAFGLFANAPTLEQLVNAFGAERAKEVREALSDLERRGYVERGATSYTLKRPQIMLEGADVRGAQLAFLRHAMNDASGQLGKWFGRSPEAHFEASVISVKRDRLAPFVRELKAKLLEMQAELETGDADALVRFNVQLYPVF